MGRKNLIWDFDGTLFDSYPHILRAFHRALQKYGHSESSLEEISDKVRVSIGNASQYFSRLYSLVPSELLAVYHEEENGKDDLDVLPFDGIPEFIKETREDGWHHFLYTHRGDNVYFYLDRSGVRDMFDDCITAADGFPSKPAPDAIRFLVRKHQLNPSDTWMIGDRIIDVKAGQNAGIHFLLFDPEKRILDTEGFPKAENTQEIRDGIERKS